MFKIYMWDLYTKFNAREESIQRRFRARPCVNSMSLFYTQVGGLSNPLLWGPNYLLGTQGAQYTIVENSFEKASELTWREWFQNLADHRNMSSYLRSRMLWG